MNEYTMESLFSRNPAVKYIGKIIRPLNGKKNHVSEVNSYVLFADHPLIPHRFSWEEIEGMEIRGVCNFLAQGARRQEYYIEARRWLKEQMCVMSEGNVSYDEVSKCVHEYECAGNLLVVRHEYFNGATVTENFTFNGQKIKMTVTYNADAPSDGGYFGWANTHTARIYNRTDNRYMTFCGNPKLDAVEWTGNVCNPKSAPDKLAFITTGDSVRGFFQQIIEYGRLGNLGYDDFLFEICKEDSSEVADYYEYAKKTFIGLNRVLGIRSYEHAGRLLSESK